MASVDEIMAEELELAEIRAKYPGREVFHIAGDPGWTYIVGPINKPPGSGVDGDPGGPPKHDHQAWQKQEEPLPQVRRDPEDIVPSAGLKI